MPSYPGGLALGAGLSGFAKGFASSVLHREEERTRERFEAKKQQIEMLTHFALSNPEAAGDPEFLKTIDKTFGPNAPFFHDLMQKNAEYRKRQPSMAELLGVGAPQQPAAAPAEPTTFVPAGHERPFTVPAAGGQAPTAAAPAAAPAEAPAGATPLERLQSRIPPGVTVPIKTREGATVSVAGQKSLAAEERRERVLTQAREEERARVKEAQPVGPSEAALWYDKKTGQTIDPETSLSDARKTAVRVSPQQATAASQLRGATYELNRWFKAGTRLFRSDSSRHALIQGTKYWAETQPAARAVLETFGIKPSARELADVTTIQEFRANFLRFLRALGEKGNIAARLVEQATAAGPQFRETRTSHIARQQFFAGLVAEMYRGTGVPIPPEFRKHLTDLDANARSVGISESDLQELRNAPSEAGNVVPEPTPPPASPQSADTDPVQSLLRDYPVQ